MQSLSLTSGMPVDEVPLILLTMEFIKWEMLFQLCPLKSVLYGTKYMHCSAQLLA